MRNAYTTCGFAVFTNVYNEWLSEFDDWKFLIDEFFQLPLKVKKQYSYSGVKENLGYNWLEEERLTPTMPGDLKESFNWVSPDRMQEEYWPKEIPEFKPLAEKIERIARMVSYKFIYRFEKVLNVPTGKLVEQHIDGSSTMRILHYPSHEGELRRIRSEAELILIMDQSPYCGDLMMYQAYRYMIKKVMVGSMRQ